MLKLQLTRDGAYDDEYLELPATPADVGEVMAFQKQKEALFPAAGQKWKQLLISANA